MTKHESQPKPAIARLCAVALLLVVGCRAEAFEVHENADGAPLRWDTDEIRIVLDESLSAVGPIEGVEQVLVEAFEAWVVQAELPMDFTVERGSCGAPGNTSETVNENCVTAGDGGHDGDSDVGATTAISYIEETGEIVDVDIVFRTDAGDWSLDGGPAALDLRRAALHEVGHLLGLEHSDLDRAMMFPTMAFGDAAATGGLHADDIRGASFLYGDETPEIQTAGCGWRCSAAPGRPGGFLLLAVIVALAALRRLPI